ncbi:hypothetical protein PCANB_002514 [Pneumocystis canis]|nr:hypothetical protein PCANB_002514 [Pneumocystis canis]
MSMKSRKRFNEKHIDFRIKKKLKIKNEENRENREENKKLKKIHKKEKNKEKNDTKDSIMDSEDSTTSMEMTKNRENFEKQTDQPIYSNHSEKFANALSKIVSSDVNSFYKNDPILSCCIMDKIKKIKNENIQNKTKISISMEKKKNKEKGRIKDIIPLNDDEASKSLEYERFLKKIAQEGVIKLFNAIRTVQIKAEEASKDIKKKGVISTSKREKESKNLDFMIK